MSLPMQTGPSIRICWNERPLCPAGKVYLRIHHQSNAVCPGIPVFAKLAEVPGTPVFVELTGV